MPSKAIVIREYGGPAAMRLEEVEPADPGPGEALVRQEAVGVNFKDTFESVGGPAGRLPFTPGVEAAGVVEAVGPGVTQVSPGDRVAYVVDQGGAYAQANVVSAERLVPVPADVTLPTAAAVAVNGMTAHYLLHEYVEVRAGKSVLIHGAAGGMGLILVQWARHLGARVLGTVSTAEKEQLARDAGADEVIRYTEVDFVEEARRLTEGWGVDLVIDGVGRTTLHGSLDCLARRGTAVTYGHASGVPEPLPPLPLIGGSRTLAGGNLFDFIADRDEMLKRADAVFAGLREGWLDLKAETVLPLGEAAKAHELLTSRSSAGKIVLDPLA
jgi:NADPH2:quinone reductase